MQKLEADALFATHKLAVSHHIYLRVGWGFASTIELWVCFVLCLRVVTRENNEGGECFRGMGKQDAARQLFFPVDEGKSNAFDQVKCMSKVCTQSRASFSPRALRRLDSGHETVQTLELSIALRNCAVSDDDDAIGTVLFQTKITQTILNTKTVLKGSAGPALLGIEQSRRGHHCSARHEMHRGMLLNQC